MNDHLQLPRFSIGVGDRFARQAKAQLQACNMAAEAGVEVVPVWNKSHREHAIIGSEPSATRHAADAAVRELHWTKPYFVDADHINLKTVQRFIDPCDFFTLDVADRIGQAVGADDVSNFVKCHPELLGVISIPGTEQPFRSDRKFIEGVVNKFMAAVQHAGEIYRLLVEIKGAGRFVPEISMDETDYPQTPAELLIILAMIADEAIPVQTIAPKFSGRFNKGVDYQGDREQFGREFSDDLATLAYAVKRYGLPKNLKLSIHSGSDKFAVYGLIHEALTRHEAGLHLKTAGTTWLEELLGLAESGGGSLELAKEVYAEAYVHARELTEPYATVTEIDFEALPVPDQVKGWSGEQFTGALRHDQANPAYDSNLRQLLHVAYKIAANMGLRYTRQLEAHQEVIARNVTLNLFNRHIQPVFLGSTAK